MNIEENCEISDENKNSEKKDEEDSKIQQEIDCNTSQCKY